MELHNVLSAKQHPLVRTQLSGLQLNSCLLHQYLTSRLVAMNTENNFSKLLIPTIFLALLLAAET